MSGNEQRFLIVHTAFIGDVVLALPLMQRLRRCRPQAFIAVLAVPTSAQVLFNHPAIDEILPYDKRETDKGLGGMLNVVRKLRHRNFDVAVVPHRSVRSAALVWLAGIPRRIGFTTSAGHWLLTERVPYEKSRHEIDRNLSLLDGLSGCSGGGDETPQVYPSRSDRERIDQLIALHRFPDHRMVALAPGSVWNTKRWPEERFMAVARAFVEKGMSVVLIGGSQDIDVCRRIEANVRSDRLWNVAGQLSLLESAEWIRRCAVIVTNDSAPMHLAAAVRTPVVAIFGATVPEFGFFPRGTHDHIVEVRGLPCRPCGIHGGRKCPIGTFDCMVTITPDEVVSRVHHVLEQTFVEK